MKVTVTVTFLRSKRLGDDSLLLHFGCFSRGVKNFFSLITKHYFSGAIIIFPGAVYICHEFKIMSDKVTAYSPLPQLGRPHYNIIRPSGGGGGGKNQEERNSRKNSRVGRTETLQFENLSLCRKMFQTSRSKKKNKNETSRLITSFNILHD